MDSRIPSGGAYDEQAATESWQKTLAFLAENLKVEAALSGRPAEA